MAVWWTSSKKPPGRDWNRTANAWAAVQHREAGKGVHVHILAARVDLETGKSLNIAAPGWQKTFDALRDWQNHENGWSRPDDSERARDVQPGHRAYIEAAQLRSGLEAEKDPRRLITDYLSQGIETGASRIAPRWFPLCSGRAWRWCARGSTTSRRQTPRVAASGG